MKKEVFTLAEDASHVGSVTDPQSQDSYNINEIIMLNISYFFRNCR